MDIKLKILKEQESTNNFHDNQLNIQLKFFITLGPASPAQCVTL